MSGGKQSNGRNESWNNFNIFLSGGTNGWHTGPLQTMNMPLIMFNVLKGTHTNWLAKTWEVNDNFTVYTIHLRDGIKWGDGVPFTADDVVFSFNMVKDHQDSFGHIGKISDLDHIEKVDAHTVKFYLKSPDPSWWITTLASNHGPSEQIVPKHVWENVKDPTTFGFYDPNNGIWPIGTGPYKLVYADAQEKVFVRKDNWWAAQTGWLPMPKPKEVVYLPNREDSTRAEMIIKNQLDVASELPVDTLLTVFKQNPQVVTWTGSTHAKPYGYMDWCPVGLFINMAAQTPVTQDKRIRHAISDYLDRTKLAAQAENNAGVPTVQMITPYGWFTPFKQAIQPLEQQYNMKLTADPAAGDALMKEAGYTKDSGGFWVKGGQRIKMPIYFASYLQRYGNFVVAELRAAGFDAAMETTPGLADKFANGEIPYDFDCKGPSGVKGMDPYYMLSLYATSTYRAVGKPPVNPWATSRWQNTEFSKIVDQMETLSPDDPQTKQLYLKAMNIWFDQLPDIYVSELIIRHMGNQHYWTGWPHGPDYTAATNYAFLHPWQQNFMKVILRVQPSGAK